MKMPFVIINMNSLLKYLELGYCKAIIIENRKYITINHKGIKRNDICPCNSGKKFKKCCINKRGIKEVNSV